MRKGWRPQWVVSDGLWVRIEPLSSAVVPRRGRSSGPSSAGWSRGLGCHPVRPFGGGWLIVNWPVTCRGSSGLVGQRVRHCAVAESVGERLAV